MFGLLSSYSGTFPGMRFVLNSKCVPGYIPYILSGFFFASPLIRLARIMSFGMIVTHFACIAQRFVSSKSPIK